MKKTRMLSTMAAAIVVVGIVPPTSGNLATHLAMFDDPNGPPITLSDGSIHGDIHLVNIHFLNHWINKKTKCEDDKTKCEGEVYAANAYDRDYIEFHGFTDNSGNAPPSPLQDTGGWLIRISNGEPGKEINPDSISLCSTASDPKKPTPELPDTTCLLGTPDPNETDQWVYLETHPLPRPTANPTQSQKNGQNGKLTPANFGKGILLAKRLDFEDQRGDCKKGPPGVCNHILTITIKTMKSDGPARTDGRPTRLPGPGDGRTYTCNLTDQCGIYIGRNPP